MRPKRTIKKFVEEAEVIAAAPIVVEEKPIAVVSVTERKLEKAIEAFTLLKQAKFDINTVPTVEDARKLVVRYSTEILDYIDAIE